MMAELITSKTDFLAMDIFVRYPPTPTLHNTPPPHTQALSTKHPDVRSTHVIAILAMRGDLNKSLVAKVTFCNMQRLNINLYIVHAVEFL